MSALLRDIFEYTIGLQGPFVLLIWLFVTALVLIIGPVVAAAIPQLVDPVALAIVRTPKRVILWMPLSILVVAAVFFGFVLTVVGATVGVLVLLATPILGMLGYLATGILLGHRVIRRWMGPSVMPAPWLCALVGLAIIRIISAIPIVGRPIHSAIYLFGIAAVMTVVIDRLKNAWQRRMPDVDQFSGETLVEWYPEGDPEEGPSVGTGRPVIGNVRGEEDRKRIDDATLDAELTAKKRMLTENQESDPQ